MNKLISRNPVLRFKLGRKLIKAQFGWHVREDGVVVNSAGVPIRKLDAGYRPYSMTQDVSYLATWPSDRQIAPGLYLESGTNDVYASRPEEDGDAVGNLISKGSEPPANGTHYETTNASGAVVDRGTQRKRAYYLVIDGSTYLIGTDGSKTFVSGKVIGKDGKEYWKGSDGSMTLLKSDKSSRNSKTSSFANAFNKALLGGYMFGKMGGWTRRMGNTISDQESLNYLKEMGLDGLNALQIQQYINQLLGNNSVKEDNKWGNLSRAGLKALYENWKMQQKPQTQSSIGNSVIEALRALEEIPQLSQDLLMFNNINSKTFNAPLPPRTIPYDRSMTRDIIKDITGNSAYNFTGDLRKALRQYLNGEQYDQEAIKAFGDLKQYDKYMKWRLLKGGILPSRNPITRFKNRKFY